MTADLPAPLRYAGFWKRFNAYGWDCLIVLIISMLASWLLGGIAHAQSAEDIRALVNAGLLPSDTNTQAAIKALQSDVSDSIFPSTDSLMDADFIIGAMVSAIYNIFFVAGYWQATPGKRWCGLKVIMADGSKPTLKQSALRHAASGISMLCFGIGYITMFFTREKMAFHDMLCQTRVVYGKVRLSDEANYS
jgi:hypothetical protein